jgi:hypothetical protein
VNHHPGMAYFGGIFGDGKVSVRALDYIPEGSFPMQATLDLAGFWRMRGFSWLRFGAVLHQAVLRASVIYLGGVW